MPDDTDSNSATNLATKAPKDKSCPFCHQAFTSSSLGRHLDLYIKPKNPKAPDGIHNVDDIRRIRGGITRRHARSSQAKQEGSLTPGSSSASQPQQQPPQQPQQASQQQATQRQGQPVNHSVAAVSGDNSSPSVMQSPALKPPPAGKPRVSFNQPNWHSTGVINNLPPRASLSGEAGKARHDQQKRGFDNRQMLTEELDHGKAAELALREVLGSVREASVRSSGLNLFDFDPFTLSFPSLCLHILPAPATLFAPSPFPTTESWSVTPPGQKQFDALQRNVRDRLIQRQRHLQLYGNTASFSVSTPSASASSPLPTPPLGGIEQEPTRLFSHLQEAFAHWKSLSEKQRQETWALEILRSYTRADEARREAESSLENARREIETLRNNRWINMGMASSASQFGGTPTSTGNPGVNTLQVPTETFKELAGKQGQGLDPRTWDYDKLIEKWTNVIKENKKTVMGLAGQRSLSTSAVTASAPVTQGGILAITGSPAVAGATNVLSNHIRMVQDNGLSTPTTLVPPSIGIPNGFTAPSNTRDGLPDSDATEVMNGDGMEEDPDADADADTVICADESQPQRPPHSRQQSHQRQHQLHVQVQQVQQMPQVQQVQQVPQMAQVPQVPQQQQQQQQQQHIHPGQPHAGQHHPALSSSQMSQPPQLQQQPLATPSLPGQQQQHSQPPTPHAPQPPQTHPQAWTQMAGPTHPSAHFTGLQNMAGIGEGRKNSQIMPESTGVSASVGGAALMDGIELQAHPGGPEAFMTGAGGWG